jgi:hypothetical protein
MRTRDALRVRAERAESDLDAARTENQCLAERLSQAPDTEAADPGPTDTQARSRTASHAKKTSATRTPQSGVGPATKQGQENQVRHPIRKRDAARQAEMRERPPPQAKVGLAPIGRTLQVWVQAQMIFGDLGMLPFRDLGPTGTPMVLTCEDVPVERFLQSVP